MKDLILIKDYKSALSLRETQKAIKLCKDSFQTEIKKALGLERISAPLFVRQGSGINDDLNGVERKVEFDIKELDGKYEVVQSLAKWKRMALYRYGFKPGEGLYTDMNAIRRDDDVDNDHSIFVDQWDWEKVITREDRTIEFLKETVKKIVGAVINTQKTLQEAYPQLKRSLDPNVYFITSQQLEDEYPDLTPKQREAELIKKHHTVFVMQIGGLLKSGVKHDGRAPDYDDWQLNGDLLFYNEILDKPTEVSSMGIRVDEKSLVSQLEITGDTDRLQFPYHKGIAEGKLPLTIGGGIGQSRICFLLLEKMHIGEVQAAAWPEKDIELCRECGAELL
ncbi:MAG: aspartate--ammonia ligase [Firmicutes bacterium]|nr:aspartate--ammonia ligase [Bacillota bacterium]